MYYIQIKMSSVWCVGKLFGIFFTPPHTQPPSPYGRTERGGAAKVSLGFDDDEQESSPCQMDHTEAAYYPARPSHLATLSQPNSVLHGWYLRHSPYLN